MDVTELMRQCNAKAPPSPVHLLWKIVVGFGFAITWSLTPPLTPDPISPWGMSRLPAVEFC